MSAVICACIFRDLTSNRPDECSLEASLKWPGDWDVDPDKVNQLSFQIVACVTSETPPTELCLQVQNHQSLRSHTLELFPRIFLLYHTDWSTSIKWSPLQTVSDQVHDNLHSVNQSENGCCTSELHSICSYPLIVLHRPRLTIVPWPVIPVAGRNQQNVWEA